MASTSSNVIPSAKHMWSIWLSHLLHVPVVFTCLQWMLQWITTEVVLPINPPQGSLAGWALGDCPITVLLWHHPTFTSLGSWLMWCGAGTPVPCMVDTYTQGNAKLWCNEKKLVLVGDVWPSVLVCHFIGGDVHHDPMHHLTCFLFPPIPNLPLSLKGINLH